MNTENSPGLTVLETFEDANASRWHRFVAWLRSPAFPTHLPDVEVLEAWEPEPEPAAIPDAATVADLLAAPVAILVANAVAERIVGAVAERLAAPVASLITEQVAERLVAPVAGIVSDRLVDPLAAHMCGTVAHQLAVPVADLLEPLVAERIVNSVARIVAEPATEQIAATVEDHLAHRLVDPLTARLAQTVADLLNAPVAEQIEAILTPLMAARLTAPVAALVTERLVSGSAAATVAIPGVWEQARLALSLPCGPCGEGVPRQPEPRCCVCRKVFREEDLVGHELILPCTHIASNLERTGVCPDCQGTGIVERAVTLADLARILGDGAH